MVKKIRLTRTMVMEYTPDPKNYPEGFTLEQMAQLDTEADDLELLFESELKSDSVAFEIIEESSRN
ncbi:hypothetical protein [Rossellomorea marisflavi]|uniref:hypothetical protein n=1 Tax=Rossellomorea marisflavi TaxID=189381 RepID=UPI003FA11213